MMEMDNGTEQLIIELREGKECAFVKVFRTYYAPLLNYAGRILHDTELANDVVQEAFCGLFERRKELKGNMLLRPYLYKVVLLIALALCQKMQFGKGNQYGKR